MNEKAERKDSVWDTKIFLKGVAREYANQCYAESDDFYILSSDYLKSVFKKLSKKFSCVDINLRIIFKLGLVETIHATTLQCLSNNISNSFPPYSGLDSNLANNTRPPSMFELSQKYKSQAPLPYNPVKPICPCEFVKQEPKCPPGMEIPKYPCTPMPERKCVPIGSVPECPPKPNELTVQERCMQYYNPCIKSAYMTNATDPVLVKTLRNECYIANMSSIRDGIGGRSGRYSQGGGISGRNSGGGMSGRNSRGGGMGRFGKNGKYGPGGKYGGVGGLNKQRSGKNGLGNLSGTGSKRGKRPGTPFDDENSQWNIDSMRNPTTDSISNMHTRSARSAHGLNDLDGPDADSASRSRSRDRRNMRSDDNSSKLLSPGSCEPNCTGIPSCKIDIKIDSCMPCAVNYCRKNKNGQDEYGEYGEKPDCLIKPPSNGRPSYCVSKKRCAKCEVKMIGNRKVCACPENKKSIAVGSTAVDIDEEFPDEDPPCLCPEEKLQNLRVSSLNSSPTGHDRFSGPTYINIDTFIKVERGQGEGKNEPYSKILLDESNKTKLPRLKEIIFEAGGESVHVTSHLFIDETLTGNIR